MMLSNEYTGTVIVLDTAAEVEAGKALKEP